MLVDILLLDQAVGESDGTRHGGYHRVSDGQSTPWAWANIRLTRNVVYICV